MRETKAHKIKAQISKLNQELIDYQNKCQHKRKQFKYGANTGNYDPSADCYWTDFFCPTCLKRWREDGSFRNIDNKYEEVKEF